MMLAAFINVAFVSIAHGMFLNRATRSWISNGSRRAYKPSMVYVAQWNRLSQFTDLLTSESRLRSSDEFQRWVVDCRNKVEDSPDLKPESKEVLMDIMEDTDSDMLSNKLLNYATNDYKTKTPNERWDILSRADSFFPGSVFTAATYELMENFEHIQKIYKVKGRVKSEFISTFLKASQNRPILRSVERYLFWEAADPDLIVFSEEVEAMLVALNIFLDVTQEIREFKYSNPDHDLEAILFELSGQQLQQIRF